MFREGDIVEIPLPDGRAAVGWILHLLKHFKDAVGFVVFGPKGQKAEGLAYDPNTGKPRSMKVLGPLYTHIDNLSLSGWAVFGHQAISESKRQWTRRQVGGGVYVGDNYLGSATDLGEPNLGRMLFMGMPVIYKEIEKAFGARKGEIAQRQVQLAARTRLDRLRILRRGQRAAERVRGRIWLLLHARKARSFRGAETMNQQKKNPTNGGQGRSNGSDRSGPSSDAEGPSRPPGPKGPSQAGLTRLRPSGGYRDLRSFQTATVIYDATVSFCARFVDPRSRTGDQMVQSAGRAGKTSQKEAALRRLPAKPNCGW